MGKKIDEVGNVYGRLTVLREDGRSNGGFVKWLCECSCGENTSVRGSALRNGHSKSCGCLMLDIVKSVNTKHGMSSSCEYEAWTNMIRRCLSTNHPSYNNYGSRGITVCDRWKDSFIAFYNDMGARPSSGHSIDRIDNDGNYTPDNCRWATKVQQNNNTGVNRFLTLGSITDTIPNWSRTTEISQRTLHSRVMKLQWTDEEAITTPVGSPRGCRVKKEGVSL